MAKTRAEELVAWKSQLDEFEDANGPLQVGRTIRLNHIKCPEGEDTRQRLYITAKLDEDSGKTCAVAYCHNCSKGGYRRGSYAICEPVHGQVNGDEEPLYPDDYTNDVEGFPPQAITWVDRWLGTMSDWRGLGIGWSESYQRIILPIHSPDGTFLGWQGRRVSGYGPKYITCSGRAPLEMVVLPNDPRTIAPETVVFVEDWMSAHKFLECTNVVAVPLFGLHFRAEWVLKCLRNYAGKDGTAIVWFDNDAPSVAPRERLERLIDMFGYKTHSVTGPPEPKYFTNTEIADIVRSKFHHFPLRTAKLLKGTTK